MSISSHRYKGIVFDMDGVLFDTERLHVDAWVFAGKETGYDITEALMIKTIGISSNESIEIFHKYLGEDFDFFEVRKHRVKYTEEHVKKKGLPVKPGLEELLQYLCDREYKLAVASSSDTERIKENLNATGILNYFNYVIGGDMITHGKPAPDIYQAACENLNLLPSDCLAIEDSPAGMRSAHKAGLQVIMIPDLVVPDESIADIPYTMLQSLGEVVRFLEESTEE